jgi:hypothetical protein
VKTTTRDVENSTSPIVYMGTFAATGEANSPNLLVVLESGEIRGYEGNTLEERWISPAAALGKDVTTSFKDPVVEFAQLTNAFAASQGILKAQQDAFALFPQEIEEDGFNPAVLVIITRSGFEANTRILHVVRLPQRPTMQIPIHKHPVEPLLTIRIPPVAVTRPGVSKASFSVQVSTGILQQLEDGMLMTYDFTGTLPKQQSKLQIKEAQSFLRLTSTSILASSELFLTVYNPKYHSVLASVRIDDLSDNEDVKRQRGNGEATNRAPVQPCKFITYFPKLGAAVAIADHRLIGIQLGGQQDRHGKLRTAGLLIDSLGSAVGAQLRPVRASKKPRKSDSGALGPIFRGSIIADQEFTKELTQIESEFSAGDVSPEAFDKIMASCLGIEWTEDEDAPLVNGQAPKPLTNGGLTNGDLQIKKKRIYPSAAGIDRRWGIYALSKIFKWFEDENDQVRLNIEFYPPQTFMWLAQTGQINIPNVEYALARYSNLEKLFPAGQLVDALVDMDRDMDLLHEVVANSQLGASELLHAVRKLMESLGLLSDNAATKQGSLTNGEDVETLDEDSEMRIDRLEAEAQKDLELAEYVLGPGSGLRGEALGTALSNLYKCPDQSIVYALQTIFSNQEIVSLIYLLRFELARGGWTNRYTDVDEEDIIDGDGPDDAIVVLSSLLNNCVDAIGAGGWLSGDARMVDVDHFEAEELIDSLKLEVSAALQGIEESAYLRGLTSEVVRYGEALQAAIPKATKRKDAPVIIRSADEDLVRLPFGLKVEKQISLLKVGAGGAVQRRTMREIGHHKSQRVGKYSREKIIL